MSDLILLIQVAATWYMTGLIWFVQVVHYPLMRSVGESSFPDYEKRHTARTTWVVGPPMLIEAATAVALIWIRPSGVPDWTIWLGIALLAVNWISTFVLQVPCHDKLSSNFDADVHKRLVSTNWIRTAAWSARGTLVLLMVWEGHG